MTLSPEDLELVRAAREALRQVLDPELGVNVVDLGLIDELLPEGGIVTLRYRLTSQDCPVGGLICDGMRAAVEALPGVAGVVLEPSGESWDPSRLSPEGRRQLGG